MDLTRLRLCVFDLDGTLVDSLRDIAEACNECLALLGLAPRPLTDYRYLVGEGVPKLCQRAIGESHPHLVARLTELVRARYQARPMRHTRPYPGVAELVATLRQADRTLAVLSNKPHEITVPMVARFWPEDVFARVQGYVREIERKPHPHHLLAIARAVDVAPADTCLIGDTPTDVETAHNAGAVSIGVAWGFRPRVELEQAGAELVFDTPVDVGRALLTRA